MSFYYLLPVVEKYFEKMPGILSNQSMEVNHYTLMAVYLSRHKELDADPNAIQQTEIVGQLKTSDDAIVTNKSMFV